MPDFTFTSPEGKSYTVSGPDGATKEQAFQVLQQRLRSQQGPNATPQAQAPKEESSGLMAGLEHFASSLIPSTAALAGASAAAEAVAPVALAAGPWAPVVEGVAAIGGGLAAGWATGAAQEAVLPESVKQELSKTAQEHPYASLAGEIGAGIPTMGVGAAKTSTRAILGTLGAGQEAVREHLGGEELDPTKIAMSGVAGAALTKPTKLGAKVAPHFAEPFPVEGTPKEGPSAIGPFPHEESKISETVFHGSTKIQTDFDPLKLGESTGAESAKLGFFFTTDKDAADSFGQLALKKSRLTPEESKRLAKLDLDQWDRALTEEEKAEREGYVNKIYKDIPRKEVVVDGEKINVLDSDSFVGSYKLYSKNPHIVDLQGAPRSRGDYVNIIKQAKELGHDAVIIKNTKDNPYAPSSETLNDIYVVFDKNNIVNIPHKESLPDYLKTKIKSINGISIPEMPTEQKDLGDTLFTMSKLADRDNIEANQEYAGAKAEGASDGEVGTAIYEHMEGKELTPEQQTIYNKHIKPIQERIKSLTQRVMDAGLADPQELKDTFLSRMLVPKAPEEKGILGTIKEALTGGEQGGMDVNVQRTRNAIKDRSIFKLDHDIIQIKGDDALIWRNGKVINVIKGVAKADGTPLRVGDEIRGSVIKDASKPEIEQHSPYKYQTDLPAVLLQREMELKQMLRAHHTIEELKQTPLWQQTAKKLELHEEMPEGYSRPESIDKLRSLEGYVFPKRMSEIITDFAKQRDPTILTNLSSIIVKNMMLNPIPHMWNELAHLYISRGLSGWTLGLPKYMKLVKESISSVMKQDDFYRSMINEGASLLAPSAREANQQIEKALFKQDTLSKDGKSMAEYIAKKTGRSVAAVYNGISARSSAAMWTVRDMMYQSYIRDLMATRKLSMKDAITEAERHIPSYRLPERVGESILGEAGSRGLSKVLNNPSVTVFSRYHYGLVKSIMETNKDLTAHFRSDMSTAEKNTRFKHAADSYAAVAIAMGVLYPLTDAFLSVLTGNEEAKQRRSGPFHILQGLIDVHEGSKEPQAVLASLFTINPALLGMAQLAIDKNIYSGRPIYNPADTPDNIAWDIAGYVANQMPQVSTMTRAASDKGGGIEQVLGRQLDVELPSEAQVRRTEKFKHMKQEQAAHRRD